MNTTQTNDPLFAAQAEGMLEMLYRRPQGYVHPQIEGVDYRRCAEVAAHLAETGRAEASSAPYGGVLYRPSAAERERKAAAESKAIADVLAVVTAQPDITVDELGAATPEVNEQLLQLALARLLGEGTIRKEVDGKLVTSELAAERAADAAAEDWIRSMPEPTELEWLKSTGNFSEQSIDRAVTKLTAAGDLDRLPDGRLEYSSALDRRMRALVIAASESSFLKKARGVSPVDVALELEIDEEQAAMALHRLMGRGWFIREVRGNAFFYVKA